MGSRAMSIARITSNSPICVFFSPPRVQSNTWCGVQGCLLTEILAIDTGESPAGPNRTERDFFMDNLLVRVHHID